MSVRMNVAPKLAVVLSFLVGAAAQAGELSTPWTGKPPAKSRLILESNQLAGTGVNRAGIHIKLDRGYWTYWRAPGSSGMPPVFDFSGSTNLAEAPETTWPVPVRAVEYGESLNLYKDEVVFPIEFRAADPKKPVRLHLRIAYGACKDVCVPNFAEHQITVYPASAEREVDEDNAELIAAFSTRKPTHDPQIAGLQIREVDAAIDDGKVILTIGMKGLGDEHSLVLVEGPDFLRFAEVRPQRADDGQILKIKLGPAPKFRVLNGKRIRITIIDSGRALEQMWVVGAQRSSTGVGLTPLPRRPDKAADPWGTSEGQ